MENINEEIRKKLENQEICSKCGGKCCKLGSCEYFVSDFKSLSRKAIDMVLQEGRTSIVAHPYISFKNGRFKCTPILYLRSRNINRGPVNLLSFETPCASLTETGCYFSFENRPSGGKHLIPAEYDDCLPDYDFNIKVMEWLPYQDALRKLVKKYTGKDTDEVFRQDAIKFMKDFATEDLSRIPLTRLHNMANLIQNLMLVYPEEAMEVAVGLNKDNAKLILGNLKK